MQLSSYFSVVPTYRKAQADERNIDGGEFNGPHTIWVPRAGVDRHVRWLGVSLEHKCWDVKKSHPMDARTPNVGYAGRRPIKGRTVTDDRPYDALGLLHVYLALSTLKPNVRLQVHQMGGAQSRARCERDDGSALATGSFRLQTWHEHCIERVKFMSHTG